MVINRIVVFIGLILILSGCSVQHKLVKDYKGRSKGDLELAKGKPARIEKGEGGQTIHIYIKNKLLKAAPINTGQFQYDKFESPKTVKTETYKFYINSSGVIDDVTYEVSYVH